MQCDSKRKKSVQTVKGNEEREREKGRERRTKESPIFKEKNDSRVTHRTVFHFDEINPGLKKRQTETETHDKPVLSSLIDKGGCTMRA